MTALPPTPDGFEPTLDAVVPDVMPPRMDEAEAPGEPEEPEQPSNLVFLPGFPHKKVKARWDARIKFQRASYKKNDADYREALQWLYGPDDDGTGPANADAKFSCQMWFADFNKLVSFYNNREPRTTCRAAKGPQ